MSEIATEYSVRSVGDFLDVPEGKLAACLEDFSMWLSVMRSCRDLGVALGGGVKPETTVFRWIDDGRHDAHVTISVMRESK